MAKKAGTTSKRTFQLAGFSLKGYLHKAKVGSPKVSGAGLLIILGEKSKHSKVLKTLEKQVPKWQIEESLESPREIHQFAGKNGPIWLVTCPEGGGRKSQWNDGRLAHSQYAQARDLVGRCANKSLFILSDLELKFESATKDQKMGALVGLELASYSYKSCDMTSGQDIAGPQLYIGKSAVNVLESASPLGVGVNLARHLVNLPPNLLHPGTYSQYVKSAFTGLPGVKVDLWGPARLKKEKMGLMLAVGIGAEHGPVMVHIKYRPKASTKKPIALVGKGITFDSGGLDLKPSSAMRLMKKDMGGSAALVGFAWWLAANKVDQPADIYLGLAENALDERAFRPGDVYRSRSGMDVEIHNTDAEGRLVLADVLDVAASAKGKDKAALIVDVATLTGAVKVGLGSGIGGLFANDDKLAEKVLSGGQKMGDRFWQMPLVPDYEGSLMTNFADINHCGSSRFGGAITAALFLEKFVRDRAWAHLDIYAWADSPKGSIGEAGGNGQGVQCLAGWLGALSL